MNTRSKVSLTLKLLTAVTALGGVLLSLIQATQDGYSHWTKRLLYFTGQSNIWIGTVCLLLSCASFLHFNQTWLRRLYVLKYVFTVSITITGLVFFTMLAPFADESYHLWVFSSYLTHAFSPIFAIADFFVDDYPLQLQRRHLFYSIIPPLIYFLLTAVFNGLNIDFGHGEPYPYYFLHFRSPAGIFGFSSQAPFFVGAFYWMLLFIVLILGIACTLAHIRKRTSTRK